MNQTTLCDAIRAKKLVKFRYKDDLLARTFSPYIVYRTDSQHLHVSGYQEHNPAKPLDRHKWRDFEVADIAGLMVSDETFVPEADFDPFHKRYAAGIICHVRQYLA